MSTPTNLSTTDTEVITDQQIMGAIAMTPARRTEALVKCLVNVWATRDVDSIQRIDTPDVHGWAMRPRTVARESAD